MKYFIIATRVDLDGYPESWWISLDNEALESGIEIENLMVMHSKEEFEDWKNNLSENEWQNCTFSLKPVEPIVREHIQGIIDNELICGTRCIPNYFTFAQIEDVKDFWLFFEDVHNGLDANELTELAHEDEKYNKIVDEIVKDFIDHI